MAAHIHFRQHFLAQPFCPLPPPTYLFSNPFLQNLLNEINDEKEKKKSSMNNLFSPFGTDGRCSISFSF
jgi:hypothetical protein